MTVEKKIGCRPDVLAGAGWCWSLPALPMRERGEEELPGKGTKLHVKEHLSSAGGGLAHPSPAAGTRSTTRCLTRSPSTRACSQSGGTREA